MDKNHVALTEEHIKNQNYKEALDSINLELEKSPGNAHALYLRGLIYFHMDKVSVAILDFDAAVELEPDNPFRYSSRAYVKSNLKDIDGAIEDYQIAIKLDPKDAIAYNNLGLLQEQKGYQKEAERSFAKSDVIIGRKPNTSLPDPKENGLPKPGEGGLPKPGAAGAKSKMQVPLEPKEEVSDNFWKTFVNIFSSKEGWSAFFDFILGKKKS
jgi:tetratricopeptide (TPR) repeat protein